MLVLALLLGLGELFLARYFMKKRLRSLTMPSAEERMTGTELEIQARARKRSRSLPSPRACRQSLSPF